MDAEPSDRPTASQRPARSSFEIVIEGYERALFLGHFLEAGRTPSVSHVEIAVCFADLRGFTRYVDALQAKFQDSRVHELLGSYFQIYPRAILETVYLLERQEPSQMTAMDKQIRDAIVPSMFKTLGDGMMLVWELPGERALQDRVSARILQVVAAIRRLFENLIEGSVKSAAKPYSDAVGELKLGFGLARGGAWRLDFGGRRPLDYAGSIVNIAARLQDLARPEGVVAEAGFCDPAFSRKEFTWRRATVTLKGISSSVEVRLSPEVEFAPQPV